MRKKPLKLKFAALLGAVVGLLFLEAAYFTSVFDHLPSSPPPADLVLVYSGDDGREKAASRMEDSREPFLFSGWDYKRAGLQKSTGLPENRILVEDRARTTDQNARYSRPLILGTGAKNILLALPWYHLPRALFLTRYYLWGTGARVTPYATSALPVGWWKNPNFRLEMVKFWGSLLRIGLSWVGVENWPQPQLIHN